MDKVIIRTSDRGIFKSCRVRWDFSSKIRQNWEPNVVAQPLEFGTAIHAGLEVYYDPEFWETDRKVIELAAKAEFVRTCNAQKKQHLLDINDDALVYEKEVEFQERLTLGLGMLENYFLWAPKQDTRIKPVMTEIEFEVPVIVPEGISLPPNFLAIDGKLHMRVRNDGLNWIPVVYQGRVDLIVQELDPPFRYWIWDHKTAAQLGSIEWLDLDEQGGSYVWALREKLGLDIAGVVYNQLAKTYPKPPEVLKNGGFSKNKQQRTSYAVYKQTLLDNNVPLHGYAEFLDYLQDNPHVYVRRIQITRTATEIRNIERNILFNAIDMLNDPSIYPSPGPFTCMNCDYKKPCLALMDGQPVDFVLTQAYRKRESVS